MSGFHGEVTINRNARVEHLRAAILADLRSRNEANIDANLELSSEGTVLNDNQIVNSIPGHEVNVVRVANRCRVCGTLLENLNRDVCEECNGGFAEEYIAEENSE